ncbi:ABC transporter permease [Xanthobacter tagetidis]|jgi:ABC-type nitrate/sulfonate/bicarbonate transport system permease component|uniref:ABC transporter permease n=1 Tax=Xanthobacter tagetidis TaxID=60216 RepID=A0A3L7AGP8_9HYPH|nr:ABC transporter permease [Xanthobacter tagetidis]MBB6306390.1 ABC-type nitrate/sulfonate/bicarbonate transport system permease component [Xanthobacter tagetidis]RLP79646.1 ABC transporter permease [Xanthobacter tagetidis]
MAKSSIIGLVPLVVLVLIWQVAHQSGIYSTALFPSPAEVYAVFVDEFGDLARHAQASIGRVVMGVSVAFVLAVPAGLLIGRFPALDLLFDWSIQIFRSFPVIALIPLAILFFGIGERPAIVLITVAAFWPLLISTIFGVKSVDRTLLKVAKASGASERLVLTDILLPSALPAILTGLRLALGSGWLTVVAAEMMAVKSGLGYLIMYAQVIFRPDLIFSGILIIGGIGLLFDQIVRQARALLCRWQDGLVASS